MHFIVDFFFFSFSTDLKEKNSEIYARRVFADIVVPIIKIKNV